MFTIYADGQLLYSNGLQETNTILTPTLKLEVGKAGSLDFVMLPGHYLYNVIDKLKTKVVAFMDETEIFRGRVLNWETDFYKQRTVHCEGNLAYLLDSLQPPRRTTMTVSAYLQEIVNEHNLQVGIEKQFTLGSVIITGGNTAVEFENNSFRDTRSAIDSELIGVYGGFLRTRTVGTVTLFGLIFRTMVQAQRRNLSLVPIFWICPSPFPQPKYLRFCFRPGTLSKRPLGFRRFL